MPTSREKLKIVFYHFQADLKAREVLLDSIPRATGLAASQVTPIYVFERVPKQSDVADAHAIIIGGSQRSVWEDVPNQPALLDVLHTARMRKLPMFGICYGAQLLAHAFGGTVVEAKSLGEWGTYDMEALPDAADDAVFADVPREFPAQCAHNDHVTVAPWGARLLARSARCGIQAFALPADGVYAVQFHAERSKADYEKILDIRGEKYFEGAVIDTAGGQQKADDVVRSTLRESPEAEAIMKKWVDRVVQPMAE